MSDTARRPRLLFVLSNDFGELSNALHFLRGWESDALLLMPERLYRMNGQESPTRCELYRTAAEVLGAAERERPDAVFLFSGYLYAINNILDVEAVGTLGAGLRRRGWPVVTSDPFLGVIDRVDASTFSQFHPQREWLVDHFSRVRNLLAGVPRLDLVPVDQGGGPERYAFFNPNLVVEPVAGPQPPEWLFVLSLEDYAAQAAVRGRAGADGFLLDLSRLAVESGRRPVLIGPRECVDSLGGRAAAAGLRAVPFCKHDEFLGLLLRAEYVFYWNLFSNSILARALSERPFFVLDKGHMAHAIPPLLGAGLRSYFAGAEVPYLDPRTPPTAKALAGLAARQHAALAGARARIKASPPPWEVVASLGHGPA